MRGLIKVKSSIFLHLESNAKFKMCSSGSFVIIITIIIIIIYKVLWNTDQSKSSKCHRENEVFSWNSDLTGFTTSYLP